jgi:hypothetical protein
MQSRMRDVQRQLAARPVLVPLGGGSEVEERNLMLIGRSQGGNELLDPVYGIKRITTLGVSSEYRHVPQAASILSAGVAAGALTVLNLGDHGNLYDSDNMPFIAVTGGGGTGATVAATVNASGGSIEAIKITNSGSGYTTGATVTIDASPAGALHKATGNAIVQDGKVIGIHIQNMGRFYTSAPTITIGGAGTGATAVAIMRKDYLTFSISAGGSGYTSAPTVTITGGLQTLANPDDEWDDGFGWATAAEVLSTLSLPSSTIRVCNDQRSGVPFSLANDRFVAVHQEWRRITDESADARGAMRCWIPGGIASP